MFSIWSYLRRKTFEALAGGMADFVAVTLPDDEEPPRNLDELRARFAQLCGPKALPAAAEADGDTASGKKKR